ncbi:MAG: sensor histidine kinase [Acidimicrobiales bacterium]
MTTLTTMTTATPTTSIERHRRFRIRPIGFRPRVLGSFLVLVAGATVLALLLQRAVLLERLEREVDAGLEKERVAIEQLATGKNPDTGQPFGSDVRTIFDTFLSTNVPEEGEVYLTFVDGAGWKTSPAPIPLETDPDLASRWSSLTAGEWGRLSTDAGPVRYLAVPLTFEGQTQGVLVFATFTQGQRDDIEAQSRVSAAVAAGVLLLATAVAWAVAGRLLRPVRQLTAAAEAIDDSDLGRRIPVEGNDEIARLARRFNEMLDRLQGSFATQQTFVDDAGHELRTPITVVRGHLELMGDDPDEQRETIALVTDELDRMTRIVDDLLLLAKSEQPDFLQRQPVDVADLTTDLLDKASALGDNDWHLDMTAPGTVNADPQRITQAVLNLARNAVEHATPGGEIGLGSRWGDDGLRLWVRDDGPGIDPADRDRIFERFARGGEGRRRTGGAGLGLAIVRSIATAHGGRVELDSTPGGGATFTIVLPGFAPPVDAARAGQRPTAAPTDATEEIEIGKVSVR